MFRKIVLFLLTLLVVTSFSIHSSAKKKCSVGGKVSIMWKGKWYKGTVVRVSRNKCLVNPDGFESRFNQWRKPSQLKFSKSKYNVGDTIYVRWKDSWWIAEIRKVKGNKWKIHYKGHSALWDEWVGTDRIREYTNNYLIPDVNAR